LSFQGNWVHYHIVQGNCRATVGVLNHRTYEQRLKENHSVPLVIIGTANGKIQINRMYIFFLSAKRSIIKTAAQYRSKYDTVAMTIFLLYAVNDASSKKQDSTGIVPFDAKQLRNPGRC
jgi:hypothetical protein